MAGISTSIRIRDGEFAAIDYGGTGAPVLLLHDVLENAEVFRDVGERLAAFCHPIALDALGHGQTRLPPVPPPVRHRMLGDVVRALGWQNPLLVGQGSGGWTLTAAAVNGHIPARALLVLECAFPGTPDETMRYVDQFNNDEMVGYLAQRFHLGVRAETDAERAAIITALIEQAPEDWTQAALPPEVVRASAERSFIREGSGWRRQPLPEYISASITLTPDLDPFPCAQSYTRVNVPLWFILASDGMYNDDPEAVEALVAGRPDRELMVVPSTRNISATHPHRVAAAVHDLLQLTGARSRR